MSIFASLPAPGEDEHKRGCAIYRLVSPGVYEFSDDPCDCGQLDTPLVYRGSHILPADTDPRGGYVDIAYIPSHITRDGKDDRPEDEAPWPYLRFGVNESRVILTRRNVEQIVQSLGEWLKETA